jgi:cytochrome c oxidase subunit 4
MAQKVSSSNNNAERHHEKPTKHFVTFAISIVLTIIAFLAVGLEWITEPLPLIAFIVFLALIQAGYQLFVWMHLKDQGHRWPGLLLFTGVFVAITAVVGLMLWSWVGI